MDLDIGSCFEIRENACLVDSIFSYCLYCYSYARYDGWFLRNHRSKPDNHT